jgi:hypothetical protein
MVGRKSLREQFADEKKTSLRRKSMKLQRKETVKAEKERETRAALEKLSTHEESPLVFGCFPPPSFLCA